MRFSISPQNLSILSLCAKKLKRLWQQKDGQRTPLVRCGSSTASCGRVCGSTASRLVSALSFQKQNGADVLPQVIMDRIVRQPFTFSDGTVIPTGTWVTVSATGTHFDEQNYPHANEFDGFRFSRMKEVDNEAAKHQLVTLGPEFVPFGYGRYGW